MNIHIHGDTHKTYFSSVKSFKKLLLNRQRIEPLMRSNQSGFRPSKNTLTQIMDLQRVLEGAKDKNLQAVISSFDFREAFDSQNQHQE